MFTRSLAQVENVSKTQISDGSMREKRKYAEIIPKAKDIVAGGWCKPQDHVIEKMADESTWLIGVDIETHDWEVSRGNKGSIGKFGFYNLCKPSDLEAR